MARVWDGAARRLAGDVSTAEVGAAAQTWDSRLYRLEDTVQHHRDGGGGSGEYHCTTQHN